jgi:hypothetical protein
MLLEHRAELIGNFVPVETAEARVAHAAEIAEVQLVQGDRAHSALLLALERADPVGRRARRQRCELAPHGVQSPHGPP